MKHEASQDAVLGLVRLVMRANAHHQGHLTLQKKTDHWCIGFAISLNVRHDGLARGVSFAEAARKALIADGVARTMSTMQCPASMCPLIAPNGSPWTGEYGGLCPGFDDIDSGGCPWWSMACNCGAIQNEVDDAAANGGRGFVVGPNQPRRLLAAPRTYDCPKASVCRWQELAGEELCPPRDALARGIDPRVCLF